MASVYRKGGRWWLRFKGPDGRWQGAPAKARTKPAARLEALERERLARQQREGLVPNADNMRRTFGELMDLWHERYGSRLRSQTIKLSVEKHLRPALGKLLLGGAAAALPALLNSKIGELSPSSLNHLRAYCHRLYAVASMRSVGWWMGPNPVSRLELPKFKEPKRKRPTVAAEHVPRVLAALSPEWRPLFATAPAPVVPLRKTSTFSTNLLPGATFPKDEAPDRLAFARKIRGLQWSGRLDLNQRPLAPQASALPGCATPRYGSSGGSVVTSAPGPVNRGSELQALLFRAFFSTCEGRNVRTRRAEISISCPVCGLRPTRDFFSRTTKFPNPESLIFSPRSIVSFSVSNTISPISADSFLWKPTFLPPPV